MLFAVCAAVLHSARQDFHLEFLSLSARFKTNVLLKLSLFCVSNQNQNLVATFFNFIEHFAFFERQMLKKKNKKPRIFAQFLYSILTLECILIALFFSATASIDRRATLRSSLNCSGRLSHVCCSAQTTEILRRDARSEKFARELRHSRHFHI